MNRILLLKNAIVCTVTDKSLSSTEFFHVSEHFRVHEIPSVGGGDERQVRVAGIVHNLERRETFRVRQLKVQFLVPGSPKDLAAVRPRGRCHPLLPGRQNLPQKEP